MGTPTFTVRLLNFFIELQTDRFIRHAVCERVRDHVTG